MIGIEVALENGGIVSVTSPDQVTEEVVRAVVTVDGTRYVTGWPSAEALRTAIGAKLGKLGPATGHAALAACSDPAVALQELRKVAGG